MIASVCEYEANAFCRRLLLRDEDVDLLNEDLSFFGVASNLRIARLLDLSSGAETEGYHFGPPAGGRQNRGHGGGRV